ncbi:MAG TPA: 2-oxoacid:acceptor oxidoreductase subunit alpha [Candidatus Bathyarchaeia archaeon]|nr:2-oxoacid:acceptor oxidoreductase subunit alpha [Candidatus Bathyarchaeia archaeon]
MLNSGTYFLQGSHALAEAAITAGLRFFAGYPITPASEIAEHLSEELPKAGGVAIQMEDELASIAALIGASWTGAKVMTATSGPGFSLMQENIGLAFMTETPMVIADMQRAGPSTGQATKCGQGDVMQARWGTHGDYASITLAPNSVQETFDLTIKAFNLAEKYRVPVILLGDEIIAHMRESLTIPPKDTIEVINRKKPKHGETMFFGGEEVPPMPAVGEGFNVTVTGSTHDEHGIRVTADPVGHRKLVERLVGKIQNNASKIIEAESYNTEDCDIGIVSFGCTSRAIYEAAELANVKGKRTGFVRLKTLWPFPARPVKALAETAKTIIVPEMNLGQVFLEVKRVVEGTAEVVPLNKVGGGEMITPEEIVAKIMEEGE